ncbi:MAG: type II toxin-antitoxin system VapB family antitoxin [Caulobacteraceae bacterium]
MARKRGCGLTEAVKRAVDAELKRETAKAPIRERIKPLQDELAAWPRTGLKADKAFFDELSGDQD